MMFSYSVETVVEFMTFWFNYFWMIAPKARQYDPAQNKEDWEVSS